jgi:hypothetical protein
LPSGTDGLRRFYALALLVGADDVVLFGAIVALSPE